MNSAATEDILHVFGRCHHPRITDIAKVEITSTCWQRIPIELIVIVIRQSQWKCLLTWRAVSRSFFTVVAVHLRLRYEEYIRPYVGHIALFDHILRAHHTIVSGSVALHFFVPDRCWEPHELDLYVPADMYKGLVRAFVDSAGLGWKRIATWRRKRLLRPPSATPEDQALDSLDEYLSSEEVMCAEKTPRRPRIPRDDSVLEESSPQYKEQDDPDHEDDTFPDFNQDDYEDTFVQMEHHTSHRPTMVYGKGFRTTRSFRSGTGRRINVVCSHSNNPLTPLRSFWTSLTMNFLTPDACVCGYPSATLKRLGALKLGERMTTRENAALERYKKRGFTFAGAELHDELDLWDVLFFGEQTILAVDFRKETGSRPGWLPIAPTTRGWLPHHTNPSEM